MAQKKFWAIFLFRFTFLPPRRDEPSKSVVFPLSIAKNPIKCADRQQGRHRILSFRHVGEALRILGNPQISFQKLTQKTMLSL
jgi:hypothetical protein